MYRNTAASHMTRHSLPSPDNTGDSDSDTDIISELEQKRRQIDEEIAKFKSQKEKEFRDFELEIRARRKQRALSQGIHITGPNNISKIPASTNPPSQPSLSINGEITSRSNNFTPRKQKQPMRLMTPDIRMQATSPTLSLEKLNITAQNSHFPTDSSTTAPANALARVSSQSSSESIPRSSPREKPPSQAKSRQHETSFTGLFVPSYLPLLEAKFNSKDSSGDRQIPEVSTEPTSPNHSLMAESTSFQSSSLPSENHVSGFDVQTNPRSYTAPVIPARLLAPIIRNVNGRKSSARKRKRVTFQLADRAIVDPSSSYEEGPSPSLESDKGSDTSSSRSDSVSPGFGRRRTPRDQFGRKISNESRKNEDEQIGMGMGDLLMASEYGDPSAEFFQSERREVDAGLNNGSMTEEADGYFSPKNGQQNLIPLDPAETSPVTPNSFENVDDDGYLMKRREKIQSGRSNSTGSISSPPLVSVNEPAQLQSVQGPVGGLAVGSGGFFELDEELASPDAGDSKPFDLEEVDDSTLLQDEDEAGLEMPAAVNARRSPQSGQKMATGFTVGSLPIDIVRPGSNSWQEGVTNSWIGTFGH